MSILYSILGIVALGLFSAVVLPILVVVFVVGIAGLVVSLSKSEAKKIEIEPDSPSFPRKRESRSLLNSWIPGRA